MTRLPALLDLVLPRRCVGCGVAGAAMCSTCLPLVALLQTCSTGVPTIAAGVYEGALRAALLRYKERGRRDLAPVLGELLGQSVAALLGAGGAAATGGRAPPVGAVLVPVPSRRVASAARGGDHLLRLARRAGGRGGLPVERPLRLARSTRDSAGLDAAQRRANAEGSMVAQRPAGAGVAVIIDDIVTTGATLREAYRALDDAGWRVLGGAVIAATPRSSASAHRGEHGIAAAIPGVA